MSKGNWLTWGALTYPFAFLITDLTNRFYGKNAARKVVLFGFIIGLVCSFMGTQVYGDFGPLVTFRIAIASASAFLTSQLLDISIFHKFRNAKWWKAPLISSFFGYDNVFRLYKHAIKNKYRFYSYGDCCLLPRKSLNAKKI